MVRDETLYFQETYLISELFKNGQWIGDYGVGIHGFIFKIPPALIFLFTQPSIEIVSIYHIILTGIVAILSYRLILYIFKQKTYALLGTVFLMCNFHFVLSSYTYLREIPSILVILLFLQYVLKKNNPLILSLLFLLLLDVKEYVFFIFALFYVIWIFLNSNEKTFLKRIKDTLNQSFLIFLPSLTWIVLMFTTSLIPINMFLASTIGILDTGFSYLLLHFNIDVSTYNFLEGGRNIYLIPIDESWPKVLIFLVSVIDIVLSYIGKVLYPRVFSFLSVPKVVLFPVIFSSVLTLKEYIKNGRKDRKAFALFSLLIIVWILIYILRASHGRYLLPLVPAISVIYLYLLFKQKFTKKQIKVLLIGTLIYISAGYLFETTYVIYKMLIEYTIYIVFVISILKPHIKVLKYFIITCIAIISFGSAILFSYVQGQTYGYMQYGKNRDVIEMSKILPENRYWINNGINQSLVSVFKNETYVIPEWKWKIKESLPKSNLLKTYGEQQSYDFPILSITQFKNTFKDFEIERLVLIVTEKDKEMYPYQEYLYIFLNEYWLELERVEELKNMSIYIFNVKL